jgi:hypothetical protein
MPINVDFERAIAEAEAPLSARTSPELARATVEIVADRTDPAKGFMRLEVQGLPYDAGKRLRRAFWAAYAAYAAIEEEREKRAKELSDGSPAGKLYAAGVLAGELGEWRKRALDALRGKARDICRAGVVGWAEGEITRKGAPVPMGEEGLDALEDAGLSVSVALAVLKVSRGEACETAGEQWAAARAEEEKPQAPAAPFVPSTLEAPPN